MKLCLQILGLIQVLITGKSQLMHLWILMMSMWVLLSRTWGCILELLTLADSGAGFAREIGSSNPLNEAITSVLMVECVRSEM